MNLNTDLFIRVTDICPRDGFQNIKTPIPTAIKIAVIDQLVAAGAKTIEITSMVSPKAIPQMADAGEVIDHVLAKHPEITPVVLVPNLKGAERAYERGIRNISYVISVSPAHNKANINRTHAESVADMRNIINSFSDSNLVLTLATAFGCPFIGATSIQTMLGLIEQACDQGVSAITLCDTIGVANPLQVTTVLQTIQNHFAGLDIGLHMHNTHGMGLANMLAGLEMGVDRFETAAGGLGGCPFAPGAAGNAATEDTVNMLHRMGYHTGYDIEKLLTVVKTIQTDIEPNLTSNLSKARSYSEFDFNYYVE